MKSLPLLATFFITLFFFGSCRKEKKINNLIGTQWRIISYKLNDESDCVQVRSRKYDLEFINDSTFVYNTDNNGCSGFYNFEEQNRITMSGSLCTEVGGDHEKSYNLVKVFARGNLTKIHYNGNYLYLTGNSELKLRSK